MANILHNNDDLFDMILPVWGQPRINLPVWDKGRQMFITDEYESPAGHRSYLGVRISDRFILVEKVGNYHTHTYINSLQMLVYDGKKLTTVAQLDFDKQHYEKQFIREMSERMLHGFLQSQYQQQHRAISDEELDNRVKALVDSSYHELLDEKTIPMLEAASSYLK